MVREFEGKIAEKYAEFRPIFPDDVAKKVVEYASKTKVDGKLKHLVDVGCGNGQSTEMFKPYFEKITAIDVSETQIEEAKKHPNSHIEYMVSSAEVLPVEDNSADVICAGIAAHWFDLPKFWVECRRVLKEDGSLVLFGYEMASKIEPASGAPCQSDRESLKERSKDLIKEFYTKINVFKQNLHILNRYADIFDMIPSTKKHREDTIKISSHWSLERFGHFWYSCAPYQAHPNPGLLRQLLDDIKQLYGFSGTENNEIPMILTWDIYMLFSARPEPEA